MSSHPANDPEKVFEKDSPRDEMSGDDKAALTLPHGRFVGRTAFQQWIRDALLCAERDGWREIVVCDANFEDWPLGERAVCDSLNAWSASGRKFVMLACNYDELTRRHARFVNWRRTWSHIVECHACPRADPVDLPSAFYSDRWAMRRLDPVHCSGVGGEEPERRVQLREVVGEWLRKSSPAFPSSVLGL